MLDPIYIGKVYTKEEKLELKIKELQAELDKLKSLTLDYPVLDTNVVTDKEKISFFNLLHNNIAETLTEYYEDKICLGNFESRCYEYVIEILNIRDCSKVIQFIDAIENR